MIEEYKSKHYRPKYIHYGWEFCGVFETQAAAEKEKEAYLAEMPDGLKLHYKTDELLQVKEITVGTRKYI